MQHDASLRGVAATRGRLIYLMGPSGSGKDSVINHARLALNVLGVAVARRVITRSAEAAGEEARSVSCQQFAMLRDSGAFALDWQANGLSYGIPVEIDAWMAEGRSVLVNGSRGHLAAAYAKYPDLLAILLTVSSDVLRRRLINRGREGLQEVEQRLARNEQVAVPHDVEVHRLDNSKTLDDAVKGLLVIVEGAGVITC